MYHCINLSGAFRETGPQVSGLANSLREKPGFRFDHFYIDIERLLKAKRVKTVVINCKMDFSQSLFAGAEIIKNQLERLVEAGKELVFYSKVWGEAQLYIASVCNRRVIHPGGFVAALGFSRDFRFYKGLLDKHRIEAEVVRIGRYKSAGDSFRVSSIDEHNREQYQKILDDAALHYDNVIASGYGCGVDKVQALRNPAVLDADAALEQGWVNECDTIDNVLQKFKKDKTKRHKFRNNKTKMGLGSRIAVLVFEGGIADGANSSGLLNGQMIGSGSFVPVIDKLRKDKAVKAVVFRINSGGGSALASEDISAALARLREKKPVVVSMASVAGSGGYWIATEAERIFAEHCCITGSIGVINMSFNLGNFLSEHGITHSTLKTGEYADLDSLFRPLSEEGRNMMLGMIQAIYRRFLAKVATARGSDPDTIHKLGEGHVYTGAAALENSLVDEVGGLDDAIAYIQNTLGVQTSAIEFLPRLKKSRLAKLLGGTGGDSSPYDLALSAQDGRRLVTELSALHCAPQMKMFGFDPL